MYDLFLILSKNIVRTVCSNDAITTLRFADSGDAANTEHPTQVPSQDPLPPASERALPGLSCLSFVALCISARSVCSVFAFSKEVERTTLFPTELNLARELRGDLASLVRTLL